MMNRNERRENTQELNKIESGELSEEMLDDVTGGSLTLLVAGWTLLNVGVYGTAYGLSKFYSKIK